MADKYLQILTKELLNTDSVNDILCYYVLIVSKQGDMTVRVSINIDNSKDN